MHARLFNNNYMFNVRFVNTILIRTYFRLLMLHEKCRNTNENSGRSALNEIFLNQKFIVKKSAKHQPMVCAHLILSYVFAVLSSFRFATLQLWSLQWKRIRHTPYAVTIDDVLFYILSVCPSNDCKRLKFIWENQPFCSTKRLNELCGKSARRRYYCFSLVFCTYSLPIVVASSPETEINTLLNIYHRLYQH